MTRGLVIAAPASGSGKTTVTLALLRHLRDAGVRVASLKVGPDYIDPAFHCAASGRACLNLDPWAMRASTLEAVIAAASADAEIIIVEGVMGLFDGATVDEGSTADVARATGWPVVLVVDASAMAASAGAVVHGFATFRPGVDVAGVMFNRVGSARHAELLVEASARTGVPVLGCLRRDASLALADRHLGLVQAEEHPDLERFLGRAAKAIGDAVDVELLMTLPRRARLSSFTGAGVSGRAPAGTTPESLPGLAPRVGEACSGETAGSPRSPPALTRQRAPEAGDFGPMGLAQPVHVSGDPGTATGSREPVGPIPSAAADERRTQEGGERGAVGAIRSFPAPGPVTDPAGVDQSARFDPPLPVLGQRTAVACDKAFAFAYPLVLDSWRRAGVEVSIFSPLAGEAPPAGADAVYLPGGYPELHAGRIAAARRFIEGLRDAAERGAVVYGECGGYMVLGECLIDANGDSHGMAGLLPVATTFAERGLTLGYRSARTLAGGPLGPGGALFRGHEFHYARVLCEDGDTALFRCTDARGRELGSFGRRIGTIMGSFVHLIDRRE